MAQCLRVGCVELNTVIVGNFMKINEFVSDEELAKLDEKASRRLCMSTKSNPELGASNLASCKSQGFRSREGKKSHLVGKKRITVGGKRIKGKKYGGPLPDYSSKKK